MYETDTAFHKKLIGRGNEEERNGLGVGKGGEEKGRGRVGRKEVS